jgi:NAD(P)-dependent dehydrogenase (short-subunit alcohol dehydrogenase family)
LDGRYQIARLLSVYLERFQLTGRVALMTGAGRGIGLAIARALSEAGAAVAIQDIDLQVARREADALVNDGQRAIAIEGDLTDPIMPQRTIEQVAERLGPVDILVNNGSIQDRTPFLERSRESSERIWRANMWAPIELTQRVLPHMVERRWGRVLNIGSIQGLKGPADMVPYSMSKGGIHNFTRSMAGHLGYRGVTINTIAPGYFQTFRNSNEETPTDATPIREEWIPLQRRGVADDCGCAALLLCSDAGGYITGQTLHVDGGMS